MIYFIFFSQMRLVREKHRDYFEFATMDKWFSKISLEEEKIRPIFSETKLRSLII